MSLLDYMCLPWESDEDYGQKCTVNCEVFGIKKDNIVLTGEITLYGYDPVEYIWLENYEEFGFFDENGEQVYEDADKELADYFGIKTSQIEG